MFKSIVEKNFDWLLKENYTKRKVLKANRKYSIFYYEKNNISIKIQLDFEYSISIKEDGKNKYICFHDYALASQKDRENLKNIINQFNNLHQIDKVENYVVDTITFHAAFLKKYISDIENIQAVHNAFTINDAKTFFQEYDCNLLGVYRDECQKYLDYYSMKISPETEEEWRKDSISKKLNNLNNCNNSYRNINSIIKMIVQSATDKHRNTEILIKWLNENIENISRLDLLVILEKIIGSKKTFDNGLIYVVQSNKALQELILTFKTKALEKIKNPQLACQNEIFITDSRMQNVTNDFDIAQKRYFNKPINNDFIQSCEKLKENEIIKNKLIIDDSKQYISIRFNEYLELVGDDGLLFLNGELNHYHFKNIDDFINFILNVANGNLIFIENRNFFSLKRLKGIVLQPWNLKMISKSKFESKKYKYYKNKWNRIYTGNELIKRDYIDYKKCDFPENKKHLTIKYMEKLNIMLANDGFKEIFTLGESLIISNTKCYILKMVNPNELTKIITLCVFDYPDLSFLDNFYDDFDLSLTDDFEMNIKKIYSLLKPILSNEIISVTGFNKNRGFSYIYTKEQYKNKKPGDGYTKLKTNIWNGSIDENN